MTPQRPARSLSLGAGLIAAVLGAAVLLFGPGASPASACSCVARAEQERFDASDAVFRGQLVGYQPPPPAPIMSSGDPAVWTFAVSEVFKGDVAPTQPVVSAVSTATCGLGLPQQGEFFVFASRRDLYGQPTGEYHADLCGGTRSTAEGPLAVSSLTPPTTVAPTPATTVPVTTAPEPEPPAAGPTPSTVPPPVTTVAVPGELEEAAVGDATPVRDDAGGVPVGTVAIALGVVLALGAAGAFGVRRGRWAGR